MCTSPHLQADNSAFHFIWDAGEICPFVMLTLALKSLSLSLSLMQIAGNGEIHKAWMGNQDVAFHGSGAARTRLVAIRRKPAALAAAAAGEHWRGNRSWCAVCGDPIRAHPTSESLSAHFRLRSAAAMLGQKCTHCCRAKSTSFDLLHWVWMSSVRGGFVWIFFFFACVSGCVRACLRARDARALLFPERRLLWAVLDSSSRTHARTHTHWRRCNHARTHFHYKHQFMVRL